MKRVYILWLLSLCILPFLQGGYFYHEALLFGVVQGMVLLFLIVKKNVTFKLTGFRWMYGLIIIASLMSSFTAIDKGMHFVGVLKTMIPFIFIVNLDSFFGIFNKKLVKDIKTLYIMVTTCMVIILLVVLLFFDSTHSLFEYFVQGPRIGGFFQYANTFGLFIYAGLMIVFVSDLSYKFKYPISIILVIGIMLTQSRGILIILILSSLLLLLFNTNKQRLLYLITFLGMAMGQGVLWWIKDHVDVFRGVALLENRSEWLIRLLYYEDSLPMIFKKITGYGHLGYYYTHQYYQTGASYKVKFLHNSLLQFTIDYGIIAGIALLLIGIYGCVLVYREFKKEKKINVRSKGIVLLVAALAMFGHSLVDFDFQFMGFVICYLTIIFLLEQMYVTNVKEVALNHVIDVITCKTKGDNYIRKTTNVMTYSYIFRFIGAGIIVFFIFLFSYIGTVSYLDYNLNSVKAYQMYPYFTDSVDHILKGKNLKEEVSQVDKVKIALETINRNPNYINGFAFLRDYYYNSGDLETAVKYAKDVYLLAPLRLDYYEIYTKITIEYVLELLNNNQLNENDTHLYGLLDMKRYINELESSRENTYNVKHKVTFQLTDDMIKILKKTQEIYNTIQE